MREIEFSYDGRPYNLVLHWDEWDGYTKHWFDERHKRTAEPDWVETDFDSKDLDFNDIIAEMADASEIEAYRQIIK